MEKTQIEEQTTSTASMEHNISTEDVELNNTSVEHAEILILSAERKVLELAEKAENGAVSSDLETGTESTEDKTTEIMPSRPKVQEKERHVTFTSEIMEMEGIGNAVLAKTPNLRRSKRLCGDEKHKEKEPVRKRKTTTDLDEDLGSKVKKPMKKLSAP